MIGKITTGKDFRGIVNYLLDPTKTPKIIDSNILGENRKDLIWELNLCAELNSGCKKPVKHISLSFAPTDGHLFDQTILDITDAIIEGLGYNNNQLMVVRHGRIDPGHDRTHSHDHAHILLNMVGYDGQIESISNDRYQQLEIYQYILEARKPTLVELCAQLPQSQPPKSRRRCRRGTLDESQRKYPKNWKIIARQIKEERNYVCQVCPKGYRFAYSLQCLRPEDDKSHLTLSEIGQLTANCHHIDGDGFNNCPKNLLVVCSTHHLFIHRGRRRNPPKGQGSLFNLID